MTLLHLAKIIAKTPKLQEVIMVRAAETKMGEDWRKKMGKIVV